MATKNFTGVPARADHTAPLPSAAVSALHRLELALSLPTDVVRAVTRFEVASHRTAELSAQMDSRDLTPAEFDALDFAQDTMRQARATLAAAGRLDLIGVAS